MTGCSGLHCNFNHHYHSNLRKKQKRNENDHDSKSNCIGKNHNKTTTSTNSKAENYNSNSVSNNNFNHHYHHNWKKRQEHTKNANFTKSNCTGNSCDKTKTQKYCGNNFLKLTGKSNDNNSRGKVSDDNIFKNGKIGTATNEDNSFKSKVKPESVTENDSGSIRDKIITSNAQGKDEYSWDFEDNSIMANKNDLFSQNGPGGGSSWIAKVKPQILTEDGNRFLRITGSVGDEINVPKGSGKIRSLVFATDGPKQMAKLTEENRKQSYSADVRFNDDFSGTFFSTWQASTKESGPSSYGDVQENTGPLVSLFREKNGNTSLRWRANSSEEKRYNLGNIANGEFAHVEIKIDLTNNKDEGKTIVLVNGKEKLRLTGVSTIKGSDSDLLPMLKFGTYGPDARTAGQVDFDNVKVTQLDSDAIL